MHCLLRRPRVWLVLLLRGEEACIRLPLRWRRVRVVLLRLSLSEYGGIWRGDPTLVHG